MDIKGRKYSQKQLDSDFSQCVAGQTKTVKIIALLLILTLCFPFTFICSYFSGGLVFNAILSIPILDISNKLEFLLAAIAVSFWLLTTSMFGWKKSSWIEGIFVSLLIAFLKVLEIADFVELHSIFFTSLILNLVVGFVIYGITFFVIRLIESQIEILYLKSSLPKIIIVFFTALVVFLASLQVLSVNLQNLSESEEIALKALPNAGYLVLSTSSVIGGCVVTFLLITVALNNNRRRQVPWQYPDIIRDLALVVGSWGGTSFHGLDLSDVNFSGAKLANTDLRTKKLYRTCFQGVTGLERARVDNQYLDLSYPKVQKLLTHGCSSDPNFGRFNLQGAYLQNADMRGFDLTDTNLTGADLKGADLRGSQLIRTQLAGANLEGVDLRTNILIDANLTEANLRGTDLRDCILVRVQVARADFTGAELTGACIEDWSISSKTIFTDVRCDYVFRKYEHGQRSHRYPSDRNFEPGEFASLFQQSENELELVFKGEFDYTALSLTFDKLQTDKPDLKLKLQGIEQRQDLWVVKVVSDDPVMVESRIKEIQDIVYQGYEITTTRLENNPLIRKIISDVANIRKTQEETAEEVKQLAKRVGSNFYFLGGTITNVTGSGEINYTEASNQVRNLVSTGGQQTQAANTLLNQLRSSNVANTSTEQVELIQFVILEEAQRDLRFKQSLLQQEKEILASLPESSIASAIRGAIAQLNQG